MTKTFGQRLKERRKELGLTQKDIGKRAGVTHAAISQWEKEDSSPTGANLFALSKALKCDPVWLIEGKESNEPPAPSSTRDLDPREEELLDLFAFLSEESKQVFMTQLRKEVDRLDSLMKELLANREKLNKTNS
jgi:transcriptional regulator with XRE-family HTH domain